MSMFVDNYNNRKHSTTKYKPMEIWNNKKEKVVKVNVPDEYKLSKDEKKQEHKRKLKNK